MGQQKSMDELLLFTCHCSNESSLTHTHIDLGPQGLTLLGIANEDNNRLPNDRLMNLIVLGLAYQFFVLTNQIKS